VLRRFPSIDPRAWEHPADRAALDALRAIPGADAFLRASIGRVQDALPAQGPVAQAVPLDDPRVQRIWRQVQATLDAPEPIELLVVPDEAINGFAHGLRTPRVALTRGALRALDEAGLRTLLAHELGHILSGHVLTKSAVRLLDAGRWWLGGAGINLVLTLPILLALYEWDRKSELSADRAEVLVTGRPDLSIALLRRSAGPTVSPAERFAWLAQHLPAGLPAAAAIDQAFSRHPPVEEREAQLRAWADSPELAEILAGRYPRRREPIGPQAVEERAASFARGVREGAQAVAERGGAALDWLAAKQASIRGGGRE
jgi:Zn-dependent protease with chaperone function